MVMTLADRLRGKPPKRQIELFAAELPSKRAREQFLAASTGLSDMPLWSLIEKTAKCYDLPIKPYDMMCVTDEELSWHAVPQR